MSKFENKLQIKTPEGGWFYVVMLDDKFAYTIYPTKALSGEHLEEAKAKYPNSSFRVI